MQKLNIENMINRIMMNARDIATTFLIIGAPVLNYFIYIEYNVFSWEIGLLLLVLFLFSIMLFGFIHPKSQFLRCLLFAIILMFFIDLQFDIILWWRMRILVIFLAILGVLWVHKKHTSVILLTVFATMNIATIGVQLGTIFGSFSTREMTVLESSRLPIFIHIILDEHIGIEGIPTDIKGGPELSNKLRSFYQENDFFTYGGAYSEYFDSNNSISSILNNSENSNPEQYYISENSNDHATNKYILTSNSYFQKMRNKGYQVKIYQSSYLDYCRDGAILTGDCKTYKYDSVTEDSLSSITTFQKAYLLFRMIGGLSFFVKEIETYFAQTQMSFGNKGGMTVKSSNWDHRVGPLSVTSTFNQLIEDVKSGPGGVLYFAHLLTPHYPYVFDKNCKIRTPVTKWESRVVVPKTAQVRQRKYLAYFEQVECTVSRLKQLFDALKSVDKFSNATIIIHGDHGSRITLNDPRHKNIDILTAQDLLDSFSTLFVIKRPENKIGYSADMLPVKKILWSAINGSILPEPDSINHNILIKNDDDMWVPVALPIFSSSDN